MLKKTGYVFGIFVLLLVLLYGLLSFLTRIDFKPIPPVGSAGTVRLGEWILDIPKPLSVENYEVRFATAGEFKVMGDYLYLTESLEEPPALPTDTLDLAFKKVIGEEEEEANFAAAFDISEEIGQTATLEAKAWPTSRSLGHMRLTLQVIIPQGTGYAAFSRRIRVNDRAEIEKAITENQPIIIEQVKAILSGYRWLGADLKEKPEGFMTRYGVLASGLNPFRVAASMRLAYEGDPINTFHFDFDTVAHSSVSEAEDPRPSFLQKLKMLSDFSIRYHNKYHTKAYRLGKVDGYETVLCTYYRSFGRFSDDFIFFILSWENSSMRIIGMIEDNDSGKEKAPEYFGLWRYVLDNAR